jgi:bacterial/archaeal transporter family protein
MNNLVTSRQFWAVLSTCFAALAAILAKVGVEHVGSGFATFIRAIVILLVPGAILTATQEWQSFGPRGEFHAAVVPRPAATSS